MQTVRKQWLFLPVLAYLTLIGYSKVMEVFAGLRYDLMRDLHWSMNLLEQMAFIEGSSSLLIAALIVPVCKVLYPDEKEITLLLCCAPIFCYRIWSSSHWFHLLASIENSVAWFVYVFAFPIITQLLLWMTSKKKS